MIKVEHLQKTYAINKKNETHAINDISFTLPDKGMIFVVGKSGSGKSTLLNILGGLDDFEAGSVIVDGNDLSKMNHTDFNKYRSGYVSFIFQDHFLVDELSVKDNVMISLNIINENDIDKVKDMLKKVELEEKIKSMPNELSGGERQRVAVARAIIKDPKLILCDEPTGALDKKTTKLIFDLLKSLSKEKLVIVVSHDIENAKKYADRIIEIFDGKIISDKEKNAYYSDKLSCINDVISVPKEHVINEYDISYLNKVVGLNSSFELGSESFINTTNKNNSNRTVKLEKKKFYNKAIRRISKVFILKRLKKMFITSLILSIIISCFAIFLSLLSFNGERELMRNMKRNNVSEIAIRKNLYMNIDPVESLKYQSKLSLITDEDINKIIKSGYKGHIYKIYNYGVCSTTSYNLKNESFYKQDYNLKKFYAYESYGTLCCDNKYFSSKFGQYEVIAGDVNNPGITITDYLADSLIYNNLSTNSYDDIIGECHNSVDADDYVLVSAIIKTDYKEKYKDIMDRLDFSDKKNIDIKKKVTDDEFNAFALDILTKYGLCYSFSKNFVIDVLDRDKTGWVPVRYSHMVMNEIEYYSGPRIGFEATTVYKSYLNNEGEIAAHMIYFNEKLDSNYTNDTLDTFEPVTVKLRKYYDYTKTVDDRIYSEIELKIVKLVNSMESMDFYCRKEDYHLFKDVSFINYSLLLDNVGDAFDRAESFNKTFYIDDTNITAINLVAKYVLVFKKISVLLSFILATLGFIYLVFYEASNISSNKREIGILKACGMAQRDISKIFILQQIIVCIIVIIVSSLLSYFLMRFADYLMVESIIKYAEVSINGLVIVEFKVFSMISILIVNIIVIMASCIIPILLLTRVKPMNIIKAKE